MPVAEDRDEPEATAEAGPPRLDWKKEERTIQVKQKVESTSFRIHSTELETILKNYVHAHYRLGYSDHEVTIHLLDPERSDDAVIVNVTKVIK